MFKIIRVLFISGGDYCEFVTECANEEVECIRSHVRSPDLLSNI